MHKAIAVTRKAVPRVDTRGAFRTSRVHLLFNFDMQASSSRQRIENNISSQLAEKEELRRGISQAAADQDDVLAAYEQFVRWLDKHERDTSLVHSYEMLEVLEEAVRTMKEDQHYKRDLRYVKLWTMYARRARKPDVVYAFLFKNAIGTSHSQLYEECALVLEEGGRWVARLNPL